MWSRKKPTAKMAPTMSADDERDPAFGIEVQPLEDAEGQLVAQGASEEDDRHPVVEVREHREQQPQQEADDPARDGREEARVRAPKSAVMACAEQEPAEEAPDGQQDQEEPEAVEAEGEADGDGQQAHQQPFQGDSPWSTPTRVRVRRRDASRYSLARRMRAVHVEPR